VKTLCPFEEVLKMKRIFSILTFIALAMVIASFLATTPSGLANIGKVLSLGGNSG
jgi:hypothetical protein